MQSNLDPLSWGWKRELFSLWMQEVSSLGEETDITSSVYPARITSQNHHQYDIVCPDFSPFSGFLPDQKKSGIFSNVQVQGSFEHVLHDESSFLLRRLGYGSREGMCRIKSTPRMTALSRGRAGNTSTEQVLAANIDTLFIVSYLDGGRNFLPPMIETPFLQHSRFSSYHSQ